MSDPDGGSIEDLIGRLKAAQPQDQSFIHDVIFQLPNTRSLTVSREDLKKAPFPRDGQSTCGARARQMNPFDGGYYGISVVVPELVICTLVRGHSGPHGHVVDLSTTRSRKQTVTIQVWDAENDDPTSITTAPDGA